MRGRRAGERDDHRTTLIRFVPVLAALTIAATAATFAPWGSSGDRSRTSYGIVDVADRAGVVPSSMAAFAAAWFLIPVLCGLVLLAVAFGRVRVAALGAASLGALVAAGGVLVARSPLVLEAGATIGAAIGGLTVLASAAVLVTARKAGRDE